MVVPRPERHDEGVAFLPREFFAIDDRCPAAAESVVDARAGMPVRFGLFVGPQLLHAA